MSLAMNESVCFALLAFEFVACCLQAVHLPLYAARLGSRMGAFAFVSELCVSFHLLIAACTTLTVGMRGGYIGIQAAASPWAPMLWLDAVAAAFVLVYAARFRRPHAAFEAAIMALCCPAAMRALGPSWQLVAFADVAYFTGRAAVALCDDHMRRAAAPTRLSIAETINVVPIGLLVTDGHARSLAMNDAMRSLLEGLDCPTDLGDMSGLWGRLVELSLPASRGESSAGGEGRALLVPDARGGVMRIVRIPKRDGRVFFLAENVTEQYLANQQLALANKELEETGESLRGRLADVQAIAEGDAYLRMRQRVHDVVGQRLSILHRYLEEGRADEGRLAELKELLASIPRDLRGSDDDPKAFLLAVTHAFSLVDVEVRITGALPVSRDIANAFAGIVREAATNACRHGYARTVFVKIDTCVKDDGTRWATIRITDDGAGTSEGARIIAGSGIAGMRRALLAVGGALEVVPGRPFTLVAEAPDPLPQGGTHA